MPDPVVVEAWGQEDNAHQDEVSIHKCEVMTTCVVMTYFIDYLILIILFKINS